MCGPTSATTASSSTGLKLQVEYTRRPPTRRRCAACSAMRSCSGCSPLPLGAAQRRQMSGALRSVPSPEQGTSHSTLSNLNASPCADNGVSAKASRSNSAAGAGCCLPLAHQARVNFSDNARDPSKNACAHAAGGPNALPG